MTYFQAYLLTRLDAMNSFCGFLCFVCAAALIIGSVFYITQDSDRSEFNSKEEDEKLELIRVRALSLMKYSLPTLIGLAFLLSLIPTTKEAAFIYIAPAIVNNQDIQKTIKKIPEFSGLGLEYLSEVLKEEIKDTKDQIKQGAR